MGGGVPLVALYLGDAVDGYGDVADACLGGNGDAKAAVGKAGDAEIVLVYGGVARGKGFGRGAVRDGDVALEAGVDVVHHLAEDAAMAGGVLEIVAEDVVVYHLVDDSVVEELGCGGSMAADDQKEVAIACLAHKAAVAVVAQLPQEGAGIGEPDGEGLEAGTEDELVEVLKPLLDVFDGKVHGMVLWGMKRVVASVCVYRKNDVP